MNRSAVEQLIRAATGEIAGLAVAVSGLAQGASACPAGGNPGGAVQILQRIESRLGNMQRLIDRASLANRGGKDTLS
jgi:hypothetical protein